jgi:glycosyltransferase involved in cell wall biosynthesis/SAM-dependent methyltransferase
MSESLPLVSAIVAAYNYERYLPEALDSALAQDYPADRLEVIVVDDGSTDGTPQIAQEYARRAPGQIRYVRQQNAGLAAATSRGLAECRGDFITLLDADDAWLPSRTRLLAGALERHPRAGLVYGDMEVIDGEGQTLAPSWYQEQGQTPFRGAVAHHFLRSNFVIAPALMVRASLRDRFAPIPAEFPTQDWYMAARVAEVAEIEFVPAAVARYRRHGANMVNGQGLAGLFRQDFGIRRWMLANLRAPSLTVDDFVSAHAFFAQTYRYVSEHEGVAPERLLPVTDADRASAAAAICDGDAALAEADFDGAAGRYLAALAADPFSALALGGLDHARQRLVVPLPRRGVTDGDMRYGIAPGYRCRDEVRYFVDTYASGDPDEVYVRAADVASSLGARRIIDLGAGIGDKLVALHPAFDILGVDHGANLELARRRHPAFAWREHDLEQAGALPVSDIEGSVVVCADVLEHLTAPDVLLRDLRAALEVAEAVVLSTPDRDSLYRGGHPGPPTDSTRVREWNLAEFAALMEEYGFEHGELGIASRPDASGRIVGVLCRDADRAARLQSPLAAAA